MDTFTLIIPVFNEAENLPRLELLLKEFQQKHSNLSKVLFVNDGSTDDSGIILDEICNRNHYFASLHLERNQGLSRALKLGFESVKTPWSAYMDSDLQVIPEDLAHFFPYMANFDLISGRRISRKDSFAKKITSRVANFVRNLFTRDGMKDSGCPLKLIRTKFLHQIPFFEGMHRFLPALVLALGGKIIEIPISHFPRKHGVSKFGTRNRLWKGICATYIFLKIKRQIIQKKSSNRATIH